MGELGAYGTDLDTPRTMYKLWRSGDKRSDLERRFLGKPESHGKLFIGLVREQLGIETETKSPLKAERDVLVAEVAQLKALLREHGIDPTTGRSA